MSVVSILCLLFSFKNKWCLFHSLVMEGNWTKFCIRETKRMRSIKILISTKVNSYCPMWDFFLLHFILNLIIHKLSEIFLSYVVTYWYWSFILISIDNFIFKKHQLLNNWIIKTLLKRTCHIEIQTQSFKTKASRMNRWREGINCW